jgi:hypothetical protein
VLFPDNAVSQQQSLKQQLVGTWTFEMRLELLGDFEVLAHC